MTKGGGIGAVLGSVRDAFSDARFVRRYVLMGVMSTVLNFGAFWILYTLLSFWYLLAAAFAFLIRFVFKFHSVRTWLFETEIQRQVPRDLMVFTLLEGNYLLAYLVLLAAFVELLHMPPFLALVLASLITSATALVVTRTLFRPGAGH